MRVQVNVLLNNCKQNIASLSLLVGTTVHMHAGAKRKDIVWFEWPIQTHKPLESATHMHTLKSSSKIWTNFREYSNIYRKGFYVSYTMACPPVRGDNPRALVRTGGQSWYRLHQCKPCTSQAISR